MTSAVSLPYPATSAQPQTWVVYKTPLSLVLQGGGTMAGVYSFEAASDCAKLFATPVNKVKITTADTLTTSIMPVGGL